MHRLHVDDVLVAITTTTRRPRLQIDTDSTCCLPLSVACRTIPLERGERARGSTLSRRPLRGNRLVVPRLLRRLRKEASTGQRWSLRAVPGRTSFERGLERDARRRDGRPNTVVTLRLLLLDAKAASASEWRGR